MILGIVNIERAVKAETALVRLLEALAKMAELGYELMKKEVDARKGE